MKNINVFIITIFFSVSLFSKEKSLNIGMHLNHELFLRYNDARESIKNWVTKKGREKNIDSNAFFYEKDDELYENYMNGNINMVFLYIDFFIKHLSELKKTSDEFWTASYSKDDNIFYCLLSKQDIKFKSFKDLKNKNLTMLLDNKTSHIIMDKKSLEDTNKSIYELANKIELERKESTIVLSLYFDKIDFGVVKKATWDTMLELNPAINKRVSIAWCSDESIPQFIGVFNNSISKTSRDLFVHLLSGEEDSEESEEFFNILPFDHIYRLKDKDIENIIDFYEEYRKLKK